MKKPVPLLGDDGIVALRPPRNAVSAERPYALFVEPEPTAAGRIVDVATVFLTNRECPFRCLMCDLWKNTLEESVAPGQIVEQIRWALSQRAATEGGPYQTVGAALRGGPSVARHLKLYNAGSFFDPKAIPPEDYAEIAELAAPFERLIVECHPRMVGRRCIEFHAMLKRYGERRGVSPTCASETTSALRLDARPSQFEVAMGLETVHPEVLPALNKGMTLDDFAQATRRLLDDGIAVRAFIMVRPPFLSDAEGLEWARRSIDFAFSIGVECCSLIPTRGGNGAMEELARQGHFAPPSLDSLEAALEYGLSLRGGRVFLDLWDIEKVSANAPHRAARVARLARMNRSQQREPAVGGSP